MDGCDFANTRMTLSGKRILDFTRFSRQHRGQAYSVKIISLVWQAI